MNGKKIENIKVRPERTDDHGAVYDLVRAAFATAEHADGNEQDLVAALRKSDAFVPQLSLVAEVDGALAGYILFTKALVGQREVLALAPLAVLPAYQRKGVGKALVQAGHSRAKALGFTHSLVLGSETYYPQFGYVPAQTLGVQVPPGMPPENFMALRLQNDAPALCGAVTYAPEFGM